MTTTQPERRTTQTESEWSDRFQAAMMRSSPPPLAMLVRGEGCRVWDSTGREYLDFLAGIAVNSLGHAHPALIRAVTEQVSTLAHVSNYFATPPQIALASACAASRARATPAACTSATRARRRTRPRSSSRAATDPRIARASSRCRAPSTAARWARSRSPGSPRCRRRSSRSPAASSTSRRPSRRSRRRSTTPCRRSSSSRSRARPAWSTCRGLPPPSRELTREHGALLILDEIQTGVGRTGRWFAYEHEGVRPDAVTIAKGIAGGVPIGALVAFDAAADLLQKGQHGSTFGGNPLATAAGNAVLTEIEDAGLVENAARRGEEIRAAITGLDSPLIAEVRGRGLLIGVGLHHEDAGRIAAAALGEGLIINAPNARSLRIAPPLIVGDDEVRDFRERFGRALAHLR
ncbi:Acetylornithine aminotransferase [Clavibacter michiganensis subsp. michiganensis]|uniref:Acetylornithine aminotransferase n=1 Tax=Clavibacter michiganensis subsp. michiganensis TaxID=33013 RepID=A0A251XGY8_CLAMM|nr:Acetylornithine aminotransferase [Clavibacter michiganensis subsp. michiganensis]OUE02427.1 Acetylornithine aminotransferase [Clavibacter michiganensis subsp. michiganensis]